MPGRIKKMMMRSKCRGIKRRISPSPVKPRRYQNADIVAPPDERVVTLDLSNFSDGHACEDSFENVHLLVRGSTRRLCKVYLENKMLLNRSAASASERTTSTFSMSKKGVAKIIWMCSRSNANVCPEHFHLFCQSGKCANYVSGKKVKLTR
jgi:hypothetical protein